MPTPVYPAQYCGYLRDMVQKGYYDFSTANAMWQQYRNSLKMLGQPDPGPCALGPETPTQPAFDTGYPGYYDGGSAPYRGAPDAANAAQQDIMRSLDPTTWFDPMSWFPMEPPVIPLDPLAAAGGFDLGDGYAAYDSYVPSVSGFDASQGREAVLTPAPGTADWQGRLPQVSPGPRIQIMARGPDGTYYPVPYVPMPLPVPPRPATDASPSPYEGVPVTSSFAIKD